MSIEELLHSADRPRELTSDELERLRSRLVTGIGLGASDAGHDQPMPIELGRTPISGARPRRPRFRRLAVAAVVLAVLGLGVLAVAGRGSDSETVIADQPRPTQRDVSPLAQVCAGELAALTEGLETWRGVENWVLTSRSQPDLGELLADTLAALADLEEFSPDATRALSALRKVLPDPGDEALVGTAAFNERETAMKEALAGLIAILRAADSPIECDIDGLQAAI